MKKKYSVNKDEIMSNIQIYSESTDIIMQRENRTGDIHKCNNLTQN